MPYAGMEAKAHSGSPDLCGDGHTGQHVHPIGVDVGDFPPLTPTARDGLGSHAHIHSHCDSHLHETQPGIGADGGDEDGDSGNANRNAGGDNRNGGGYNGDASLKATPPSLDISPGETKSYTVSFSGNPIDLAGVECGDSLLVRIWPGDFLAYLDMVRHNLYYETDGNGDGSCSDGMWVSSGSTVTVSVAEDAPGNAAISIAYAVENRRVVVLEPRSLVHISVSGVVPPSPTPTPESASPRDSNTASTPRPIGPPDSPSALRTSQPSVPRGGTSLALPDSHLAASPNTSSTATFNTGCALPTAANPTVIIARTSTASALALPKNWLRVQLNDRPHASLGLRIGRVSSDGLSQDPASIIRDRNTGATSVVVRHHGDPCVVRRWVPPDSPLVNAIPWKVVKTHYTVPAAVVAAIPLDERLPEPNMLARRFNGVDLRIFAFDAKLGLWRHVPDIATFQHLGFYWCNVNAADPRFFERITIGPPFARSLEPARADYPSCGP